MQTLDTFIPGTTLINYDVVLSVADLWRHDAAVAALLAQLAQAEAADDQAQVANLREALGLTGK